MVFLIAIGFFVILSAFASLFFYLIDFIIDHSFNGYVALGIIIGT